jgi:SAM-dependent methyltransferase
MDKITRHQLQDKIDFLYTKLVDRLKIDVLPKNVFKWLKGVVHFLESKTYMASNIDDILWFYANGLSKDSKIMDFGAGGGYITYLISQDDNEISAYEYKGDWTDQEFTKDDYVIAFSFVQKIINESDEKIKFKYYSSLPLDEKDEVYDGIILYAVVEHIDPTIESNVFKELYRLLKPGGSLYIAKLPRVLSYQEYLAKKLGLGSHSNLFTKKKISKLLNKYGLEVTKIEKTDLFFSHPNKITNFFFPITHRLEKVLKFTPLNYFSHCYRLVAKKTSEI